MSLPMVRLSLCLFLLGGLAAGSAHARVAQARIARVTTAVAVMEQVVVRLEWPAGASAGSLRLRAGHVHAPDLGYRFSNLEWSCPLARGTNGQWACAGELRSGRQPPMRLALDLRDAGFDLSLARGDAKLQVSRRDAEPDLTRIDLTRVPLAWTQALLAQAWPEARLTAGRVDSTLTVTARAAQPLQIAGPLTLIGASLDTPDGRVAAENLGARLAIDAHLGARDRVVVDGELRGGELLFGNAYVTLDQRRVGLRVEAEHENAGWRLPRWRWDDAGVLTAQGRAAFDRRAELESLDMRAATPDLSRLAPAYLSGLLGAAGLGELELRGRADAAVVIDAGTLRSAALSLDAAIADPRGRFAFDGLAGDVRFSAGEPAGSELRWRGGTLYGVGFGETVIPLRSEAGMVAVTRDVALPLLGGHATLSGLRLRPPAGDEGMDMQFGLNLDRLDIARLVEAVGGPAFTGELSGRIPRAHYRDNRLVFDGGLAMRLFEGEVSVSSLVMERPFGVAPTLSADVAFEDLDLEALTGVLGFGTITGRLDGRFAGLRLVDWQPVAFDASLRTDRDAARRARVRQRISQRAVQDLSSVGDASLMSSLQAQLIGVFDDFGYSGIGISCRLAEEVCAMDGLGSAGRGFIIVQGSGIPRLSVVGFNRRVDWPMLVERLVAVGAGDVKPVVD